MDHFAKALNLLICVVLLLAIPRNAQAQDDPVHSLHDGAWALQYSVGQNFVLGSFLGQSISAKKHVADARAWELGVTLNFRETRREVDSEDFDSGVGFVAVTARHLWYPGHTGRVDETIHWFLGIGPRLSFSRNADNQGRPQGTQESRSTLWGVGLSGVVGTEWFVHEHISLFATYGTGLDFSRESRQSRLSGESENETTESSFTLQSDGVRFGISVYL